MKTDKEISQAVKISVQKDILIFDHVGNLPDDDDTNRLAELKVEEMQKILDSNPQKHYKFLVNLAPLGAMDSMPSKARKAYAQFAKNKQLDKAAIVGGNIHLKTIINFIMKLTGRGDSYKVFDNITKAKQWLSQN